MLIKQRTDYFGREGGSETSVYVEPNRFKAETTGGDHENIVMYLADEETFCGTADRPRSFNE